MHVKCLEDVWSRVSVMKVLIIIMMIVVVVVVVVMFPPKSGRVYELS